MPASATAFADPTAWSVGVDDDAVVAPPATATAQRVQSQGARRHVATLAGASSLAVTGAPRPSAKAELPPKSAPEDSHGQTRPQLQSVAVEAASDEARHPRSPNPEDGDQRRGWDSEEKAEVAQLTEVKRSLQQQNSLLSQSSRASFSDMSLSRAKSSLSSAMRYFGFGGSDAATLQDTACEMFELCLSICLATAPDVHGFVEAFGYEDKKALRRLCATAKRVGLMGSTPKLSTPVPVAEMARAFMAQGSEEASRVPKGKLAPGSKANLRSDSFLSLNSQSQGSSHDALRGSAFAKHPKRQVTFDSAEMDDRPDSRAKTLGLARGQSGIARSTLDRSRSDLGKVMNLNRSISDLSCTSFTDFNRRNMVKSPGATNTIRPTFLDFLGSLGQEQAEMSTFAPTQMHETGVNMVMDVAIPSSPRLPTGRNGFLDTVSEAGISYHSSYDMAFGSEGEEREVVQAQVIDVTPGVGAQNGKMRIAFKSRCLRTQNEWQRQLLVQQRVLLDMVSTKLQAKEKEIQAGDELRDEQKELLRGFRKIIVREVAEDEGSKSMCVSIVEKEDKVRSEMEELCRILEYPYQAFRGLSTAIAAIKDDFTHGTMTKIESEKSMQLQATEESNEDKLRAKETPKLLEGRADATRDWRSRALLPQSSKKSAASKYPRKPTSASSESDTIHVVLLGSAWLEKDLPKDWLTEERVFVVLTSQAEDFENVGRFLLASGEAEIREKLRARGVNEYLLHPLSLEGLRGAVCQAFRRKYGDEYLLLQAVGRGTSGVVHRAKRLRDGDAFALKEINTKRMSKSAKQEVERESQLLSELRWPTVVFLVDTWENTGDRLRYILMPLLEGGSLHQYIESASKEVARRVSMDRISEWYAQTLHGLTYLHWRGVLHRDLKPGNLLITGTSDRALQIGDLGSAMLLPGYGPHPMKRNMIKGQVCTPLYAAPEILLNETYSVGSDVWAVGSSFYEVMTFGTFFPSGSIKQLQDQAEGYDWKSGPWASALHAAHSSLPPVPDMAEMLRADPVQRPLASELVGRAATFRRLKAVLEAVGALQTPLDRNLHFEDLARIRSESESAANLDPATATRVSSSEAVRSPRVTRLPAGSSAARSRPGSLGPPATGTSIRGAAGGLARAGSGLGTSLRRASSGAMHWAKGGRHSGEDRL